MNRCRMSVFACALTAAFLAVGAAHARVEPGPTRLASTDAAGIQGNDSSTRPVLSADGSLVAFASASNNLVPADANEMTDVFVKDLSDGSLQRISLDDQGRELPGHSDVSSMTADGQHVLFWTTEIAEHADGVRSEIQLRLANRATGTSSRIDVYARDGKPIWLGDAMLSGNGRYVAFATDQPLVRGDRGNSADIYRLDLTSGTIRRVSVAPIGDTAARYAGRVSISRSGRVIAFQTEARLVKRDRREWGQDVYVRDMHQSRPRLVSVSSSEEQADGPNWAPAVSASGRYVAFSSLARNLVRRDTNNKWDVFVRDRRSGTTERASVNSRGRQANHHSQGTIYHGVPPSISANGRFVVFGSLATNLDAKASHFTDPEGSGNVYLRDRRAGTTMALSMAPDGTGADASSGRHAISADGSAVALSSEASNLVDNDTNRQSDVFVRRLGLR